MDFETATLQDVSHAIYRAVPTAVFLRAKHDAVTKSILALADDPEAHGDVATHLVRVFGRRSRNAWVDHQADKMTLDIMQLIVNRLREVNAEQLPAVFQGWTVAVGDDGSRRNKAFKLYVIERIASGRSWLLRLMYNAVLYYVVNRDRDHVDISMCYPDEDEPDATRALGHKHYAYSKQMVIGPAARINGEENAPVGTDGSTVQEVQGCLVQDSDLMLKAYLTTSAVFSPGVVAALANMLRGIIIDLDFDWHFVPSPDQTVDVTEGPNAWRLLLPRLSTRETIDGLKYAQGMC